MGSITRNFANNILTDGKFDATDVVGNITSTGIDDNATSNAITIDSNERVQFTRPRSNTLGNSALEILPSDTVAGIGFRMENTNNDLVIEKSSPSGSEAEILRIRIGGGIALGGTGDANTLDHYETGTWTPTVATGTVSSSRNRYERIGNVVILSAELTDFSDTTSSNAIFVQNFPFTPASSNNVYEGVARTSNSVKAKASVLTFGSLQFYEDSSRRLHSSIDSSGVIYYFSLIYTTND